MANSLAKESPLPRLRGRVREGAKSTAQTCGKSPLPTLPRKRGRGSMSHPLDRVRRIPGGRYCVTFFANFSNFCALV
jgi:hypothetical protein